MGQKWRFRPKHVLESESSTAYLVADARKGSKERTSPSSLQATMLGDSCRHQ